MLWWIRPFKVKELSQLGLSTTKFTFIRNPSFTNGGASHTSSSISQGCELAGGMPQSATPGIGGGRRSVRIPVNSSSGSSVSFIF